MRLIVFVSLDHFYAWSRQIVGSWVLHRDGVVLDASYEAECRGVHVGMGLAEAKTILAGDGQIEMWEPEPYRSRQEQWLDGLNFFSDIIEPVDQHSAFADLSGHPSPIATVKQLHAGLRDRVGCPVRIGVASARFVAQLAAHVSDPTCLAARSPARFVAPLSVSALPVPEELSARLKFLGYDTIGEVAAVSAGLLRQVFGEASLEIIRACRGRGDGAVKAVYPPRSISARFSFEGPVDTSEVFDRGLEELAKLLAERLGERDAFSERLDLVLEFDDGAFETATRTFARSIHTPREALAALRLMLSEPPERPILGVRARLRDVKESARVQSPLAFAGPPSERHERSRIAFAHIRGAFGDGVIQSGSELIEPRWKEVRRVYRAANGWTW